MRKHSAKALMILLFLACNYACDDTGGDFEDKCVTQQAAIVKFKNKQVESVKLSVDGVYFCELNSDRYSDGGVSPVKYLSVGDHVYEYKTSNDNIKRNAITIMKSDVCRNMEVLLDD